MRNGKGSKRRLALVQDHEVEDSWVATFGHLLSRKSPIQKIPKRKKPPRPEAGQWSHG